MKYKIKKMLLPIFLIILGITIVIFISFFKQEIKKENKQFKNKYIAIKIKGQYPFTLLFKKGITIEDILKKFGIGAREIYVDKNKVKINTKIYEDTTLQIK